MEEEDTKVAKCNHKFVAYPITGENATGKEKLFNYKVQCEKCKKDAKDGDLVEEVKASHWKQIFPKSVKINYILGSEEGVVIKKDTKTAEQKWECPKCGTKCTILKHWAKYGTPKMQKHAEESVPSLLMEKHQAPTKKTEGKTFFCKTHLCDVPLSEQSPDPRYCNKCYKSLVMEARNVFIGRPSWIPDPMPEGTAVGDLKVKAEAKEKKETKLVWGDGSEYIPPPVKERKGVKGGGASKGGSSSGSKGANKSGGGGKGGSGEGRVWHKETSYISKKTGNVIVVRAHFENKPGMSRVK